MKRIGPIAARLVANPELMRAALSEPAREFRGEPSGVAQLPDAPTTGGIGMDGGSTRMGGERAEPPDAQAPARGTVASELKAVAAQDGDPAQPGDGANRRTIGSTARVGSICRGTPLADVADRTVIRPALRLVMGGRGRAIATANTKGRPQPSAVARPLLLVVGGTHYTASGSF